MCSSLVALLEALCCNVHVALLSCFDILICEETYVYYTHTHVYTYTRLLELFARTIFGTHMTHECVVCVPKIVTIACFIEYGVALVSRIDKIIGLFCKRDL